MVRQQDESKSIAGRKRPKSRRGPGADQASSNQGKPRASDSATAKLHLHVGNAVVHAALAGGEENPYGSMIMGSVLMDAAGMSGVADLSTNSAATRSMASKEPNQEGVGKAGGGKRGKQAAAREGRRGGDSRRAGKKALDAMASKLHAEMFLGEGMGKKGRPPAQKSNEGGQARTSKGSPGKGEPQAPQAKDPILAMLPMVESLFAEEVELAKSLGTTGLLAQLEKTTGGEMPVAVALRLMQTLGEAKKAGGEEGANLLQQVMGKKGAELAELFLPQTDSAAGDPSSEQASSAGGKGSSEGPQGILPMLPKIAKLLADQGKLAEGPDAEQLLEQLEKAAKGALPGTTIRDLLKVLSGGQQGAEQLQKAMGEKGAELAELLLPQGGDPSLGDAGPEAEQEESNDAAATEQEEKGTDASSGGSATSEQEAAESVEDILPLLPKIEKLLADEGKLAAALGTEGLLAQLEKATKGELPGAAVRELVQVFAGGDQGAKLLEKAMGDQGADVVDRLGLEKHQGDDSDSADASSQYAGAASQGEAADDGSDVRAMLPMVEGLFSEEADLTKALSASGLLGQLEEAAGGDVPMTEALKLLQALGTASKAGGEEGTKLLQEALGEKGMALAKRFLPQEEASGPDAGGQDGPGVIDAPLQVARSVFKDRLTPSASDGSAGLQEIADVKGADFGASRPLRSVLDSGHGAFSEAGFSSVIDAMASAMESASWEGYDSGRILGAGAGALTERINAAPENSKVATALEIARKGNRTSVPFQRRLQQDLRHLLEDGDGGFDSSRLNSIQVYISDVACRSLNAEAFTYGNMIVLRSEAPTYEVVKEEVIHVIQQGGVNIMALPSAASMTSPTDAVEVEAAGMAGGQRHADSVTTSSLTVARSVNIAESQGEVFNAVVQNVIPDGYSSNIGVFTSEADQLQGGLDSVKDVINTADSFPLDKVDALFSSDAFDIFDPNPFQTSLKASGDTIVDEVVGIVMGICDNALGILDGMIGVVTEIMNVVESFVQLLDSMANAMDVLGAILIGIGTGLIFVVIPSGIGSQFVQWGNDLRNIGSKISNVSDQVKSFLEPLQEVIDKIEKVKEQIEKIREITQTIQECLDVYEWFASDTSEARRNQSDDMLGSVERTGELLGQLTGGKYQDFATKFWENSLPVISYMLEGQPEVRDVNDQMNPGALGIAVPGAGPSAPGAAGDPNGVNEAFAQKKGERGGEGKGVFSDIVDPISWPTWFKPKPSDGISVVIGFITKGTAGDSGMPGADSHAHPGQTQGGGAGGGSSIVSGAIGTVGNMTHTPLNVESLVTSAVEVTSHTLDQDGYPSNIAETFDYLNHIVQMGEPADSLEVQGSQRMQEARILQENAQNSITAAQNITEISIDQQEKSKRNEEAAQEGVGFTQYLQSLSQELQSNLQQKMQEMLQAQALTDDASNQAVPSAQDAAKGAESGGDLGVSGGSIASMIATAIIQVIIQQLIPQLGIGEMLKNLIPEDLGKIIDLATTFIDTAQGSFDRAVMKEQEASYSEGVLNEAISTDQKAQAQGAQQQSQAEQMRATAETTLAAAQQAESDGQMLREQSAAFDQALKDEQAWIESNLDTHLSEAGPMRPRTETEFVDAPTKWEGVGVDNPQAKAAGDTVVNEGPLPVSSDMGYPDPVAGPVPTELIQAVPLPPVISDIFSSPLDGYRMYSDLDLKWSGNTKQPTTAAPAGTPLAGSQESQSTREQPQDILIGGGGGGGGGGYDEGWEAPAPPTPSAEELVTQRELIPDQLETHQGVEKRAEDPQIPFTPVAQRAQLSQPANDALLEQEAQRAEQIQTAQGQIPEADYMYNTLAPLPSILPPQPEFAELEPMDTSGLGYNSQQIMIDPDIAQVRSWISSLPTTVKLLGPGTTGGLSMPTIMKPQVPTAAGLAVPELPALVLHPVPGIQTPGLPATQVRRDHPEKLSAASDVRGADGLLDLKHQATLQVVGEHASEHESREGDILGQAQQRTSQVQNEHQSSMDQTLARRDQLMKEIRGWMEQSQDDTIRQLEQQAQDRENARFDAMQGALDTGLSDADMVMREGESTAFSLQDQATSDAMQVNAEAMAKVATMWGWFQSEVSTFTANIATMLSQLWNSANTAVDLTLTGAQMSAMNTLTMASDRATIELSELGLEVPRIYGEARSKLGDIGDEARARLRNAIDETVDGMITAATTAATAVEEVVDTTTSAIDQLSGETRSKVETEWEDFDAFAEKLRRADVIGPNEMAGDEQARDPAEPIPTHPGENRSLADAARTQGGATQPGPDASGQAWQMPQERQPAPIPQGQSASAITHQFTTSTPTAKAETWKDIGQATTQAVQADETTFQPSIAPLNAQMGGETTFPGHTTTVNTPGGGYQQQAGGALPTAEMAPTPVQSTEPLAQAPQISAWSEPGPETDARPNASQVAGQINLVPVTDPSVITSPGPAPAIPLTGAVDPARLGLAANEALTEATGRTTEAMQQVADSPGPELVVPLHVEQEFPVQGLMPADAQEATQAVAKMDEYLEHALPGDVTGQFDAMYGPDMESSLADAKQQVFDAETQRDLSRETQITDAQQQARTESERAQTEQLRIVDEKRTDISQKREETVQAQQDALDQLSEDARSEYDLNMAKAKGRVDTTQRQINQEFISAQRRAEEEVRRGERQAAEEKRRAESESESQSWWRRAASWVSNALRALTDTINSIFDAVRSAVTSIIDGVKALAATLIDAATAFIQHVIEGYGQFLTFAIDNLIGTVFPELAQELTEFVDAAVDWAQSAIEHLATNLKTFVGNLLDTLKGTLDAVLKLFQTVVNVQLAVVYAVLSGDWEEGLKMALDAVLALAGIDSGEFYSLLGTADDTIMQVLRNPGEFVGNAIDAAGQGFGQFGGNFMTHVINGFAEWATGASISVGLLMPEQWNARSVFAAGADLMGLSEPKLMQKTIDVVGQENVARFSWVWDFVDNAIQGGVIGLWDHVQGNLGGMYEGVVDTIQNWLMTNIAQEAAIKLISMFSPVGAIVQAVLTAWDVYSFLRDNVQRIYGVISSFMDNFSQLAMGSISAAANGIESALADLIPIAIDLLAEIFGLSGAQEKVFDTVDGIRGVIDTGVTTFLEGLSATFPQQRYTGMHDSEKSIPKHQFDDEWGNPHELWMEEDGSAWLKSDPMTVDDNFGNDESYWYFISSGAQGQVGGMMSCVESGLPSVLQGNTEWMPTLLANMDTSQSALGGAEAPFQPEYIEPPHQEADAKKVDESVAEGTETSEAVSTPQAVIEGDVAEAAADAANAVEGPGGALPPEHLPTVEDIAGKTKFWDEYEHREDFLARADAGGMDTSGMAWDALKSGALAGLVEGGEGLTFDVVTALIGKGVVKMFGKTAGRYLTGFTEIAQMAYDPGKWFSEIGGGLMGGGSFGEGMEALNRVDLSDGLDIFEVLDILTGVVLFAEGIGNIISTASRICWFVAGLTAIIGGVLLLFGVGAGLLAFAALAAKWAALLGTIATAVGFTLSALRLLLIVFQSVALGLGAGDPTDLLDRQALIEDQTQKFVKDWTERAGDKVRDRVEGNVIRKQAEAQGDADGTPVQRAGEGDVAPQTPLWKEMVRSSGVVGHKDAWGNITPQYEQTKAASVAYGSTILKPGSEKVEAMDAAGTATFASDADREKYAKALVWADVDNPDLYFKGQQNAQAAAAQAQSSSEAASQQRSRVSQAHADLNVAKQAVLDAPALEPSAISAANQSVSAAQALQSELRTEASQWRSHVADAEAALRASEARKSTNSAESFQKALDAQIRANQQYMQEAQNKLRQVEADVVEAANIVRQEQEVASALQLAQKGQLAAAQQEISADHALGEAVAAQVDLDAVSAKDLRLSDHLANRQGVYYSQYESMRDAMGQGLLGLKPGAISDGGDFSYMADSGGATHNFSGWMAKQAKELADGQKTPDQTIPDGMVRVDGKYDVGDLTIDADSGLTGALNVAGLGTIIQKADVPDAIGNIYQQTVGQLPEPPHTDAEASALFAGHYIGYEDLNAAQKALEALRDGADDAHTVAENNAVELDNVGQIVHAGNEGLQLHLQHIADKLAIQKDTEGEANKADSAASDAMGKGLEIATKVGGFIGGFLEMIGVVPGRWSGKVAGGTEAASTLKEAGPKIKDGSTKASQTATASKTAVLDQQSKTTQVQSKVPQSQGKLGTLKSEVDTTKANNDAFEQNSKDVRAEAEAELEDIAKKRQAVWQEHQAEVASVGSWAGKQRGIRESGSKAMEDLAQVYLAS